MHLEKAKNKTKCTTEWACLKFQQTECSYSGFSFSSFKKNVFYFLAVLHSTWDLISQPRMEISPPALKRGVLAPASPVKPLTVAVKRQLPILTDVHGGLAPEQQLQTLWLTVHTTVVQGRVSQGRLLIQIPTEKRQHLEKNDLLRNLEEMNHFYPC